MLKVLVAMACAVILWSSQASAQIAPPPPPPGGGGASTSSSPSSQGGRGGLGTGGAIAMGCVFGAAGALFIGHAEATGRQTQMTPRGAWVAAANGCVPVLGGMIANALLPPDNPCTLAIARKAYLRYQQPRYRDELWIDRDKVAAEFQQPYHVAYTQPCVVKKISRSKTKKNKVMRRK